MVINNSANANDLLPEEFQEGFSDVIGYAVEFYVQPSGSGPETEDWTLGEDTYSESPLRRVDVPTGNNSQGLEWHRCSIPQSTPHSKGNKLGVAFRLMAVGGENNGCSQTDPGCDASCDMLVENVNIDQTTDHWMDLLLGNVTHATHWENLASLSTLTWRGICVRAAAPPVVNFDLTGKGCIELPGDTSVLRAAHDAFSAIGYPPRTPLCD